MYVLMALEVEMRVVREKANAKINLFLDVTALREDGFHEIKSVMHSVSLSDKITVKYIPSKNVSIKLRICGCKFLPTDEKNLAYRAAQLFLERGAVSGEIQIYMEKRIPIAAGLAGGSADAAAVLRAMNKLFDRLFSEKALFSIGAELGSDVPFCIHRKTALCEGRGEQMSEIYGVPVSHFVIACPKLHISTPSAYKRLDELYSSFDGTVKTGSEDKYERLISSFGQNKIDKNGLFNIFESAVLPLAEESAKIKTIMLEEGADGALMSGSGPSVFGIFSDRYRAERVAKKISQLGFSSHYAHSV